MKAENRKLFENVFKAMLDKRGAFTLQDKLALAQELLEQAQQLGSVPISENQMARVNVDDPRVQALIAGEEIALSGATLGGEISTQDRMVGMDNTKKVLLLVGVVVIIFALMGGLLFISSHIKAAEATPTTLPTETLMATATGTVTAIPPSQTPQEQLPEQSYRVVSPEEEKPSTKPNDPISIEFGGLAFVLAQGKVISKNTWEAVGGEWLTGTELRRVVAIPFSQEVGRVVDEMVFGDEIKLRLNSGEVVTYRLNDIVCLKRHEIEVLSALKPSIAVVLHGERSGERYVLLGDAVQGCGDSGICYTPTPTFIPDRPTPTLTETATPTITPSTTATATPEIAFDPPFQNSVVVTDTWTVSNDVAGLQLEVLSCARIKQIGEKKGSFVVCDVTLTATQQNAEYSGQTLTITEFNLVENSVDWWPDTVSVAGAFGDGRLGTTGDSVMGKVAGEVKKGGLASSSDPVLLWEQAGIRYVIYLE